MFGATGTYTGGYSYTPYGELRSATSNATITANSVRYAGGYWDSSVNLYRLGARYYDPTIGRFTQYDPSGQEANPYAYAANNPINKSDPTGLSAGEYANIITQAVLDFIAALACTSLHVLGCVAVSIIYGALGSGLGNAIQASVDGKSQAAQKQAFISGLGPGALKGLLAGAAGKIIGIIAARSGSA